MDSVKLQAYGKINLSLDVLRQREDGYHDVRMIMQTVKLHDNIDMQKTKEPEIKLTTNLSFLPVNENNLMFRAAKMIIDEFDIKEGVSMQLKKVIPVSAGMA
ncbi:MAG: 4-(cytidine 5'-diphospho)-2-C-methyl-D-erythritol kinase, partial [Oribacterium sp.]|nr:4-(cytidine 5'-diphospho)-2-C-methyl-D-erythritol kinase [Oribacterium sp.]